MYVLLDVRRFSMEHVVSFDVSHVYRAILVHEKSTKFILRVFFSVSFFLSSSLQRWNEWLRKLSVSMIDRAWLQIMKLQFSIERAHAVRFAKLFVEPILYNGGLFYSFWRVMYFFWTFCSSTWYRNIPAFLYL